LIGISRAHNLAIDGKADIAAFVAKSGEDMIRPGGLAGEPKTAAVVFGIYLITSIFAGFPMNLSFYEKWIGKGAIILAVIGYLTAFSTSAFIGGSLAFFLLLWLLRKEVNSLKFFSIFILSLIIILVWKIVDLQHYENFLEALHSRTFERLINDFEFDPPIEACLNAMAHNLFILIFGCGMGGSSFIIMKYSNLYIEYAYAPNVMGMLLLTEYGIIGTLLLLIPFTIIAKKSLFDKNRIEYWNVKYLFCMAISGIIIILSGSGIAMGEILSISCICAYSQICYNLNNSPDGQPPKNQQNI